MRKVHFAKMRDRRNTNLSISSMESSSSASTTRTSRSSSLNEKRHSSPPPPSPALPPPVTKANRPTAQPRRTTAMRLLAVTALCLLIWTWLLGRWTLPSSTLAPAVELAVSPDTELVAGSDLPDEPTAFMVRAADGTSKWTISIPNEYDFPLAGHQYEDMCSNGAGLRNTILASSRHSSHRHWWQKSQYYAKDETFVDIAEAEEAGLLPKYQAEGSKDVCDTSLTFVLDSDDASFGTSLLQLWLSYGLAKKENRAFFIDDSRWAWGNYSSYFMPPPSPPCSRPPPHHIVPCPPSAHHLVVSSATAPWTFGAAFTKEFQLPRKHAQDQIFSLLRTGYEDLFHLKPDDALYATNRIASLGSFIGMQIRRGDSHPHEYQYSRDYLPLERYAEAAKSLGTPILLASDDPEILLSPELSQYSLLRAQDRIQLATKATLPQTSDLREPGSAYTKHVDENTGWEGGFYPGLFFSLGEGVREYVGRAYLLDLAVLAEADGVVCAVSSATCRVLGVMMGVRGGRWVNVDDGRGWSWHGFGR